MDADQIRIFGYLFTALVIWFSPKLGPKLKPNNGLLLLWRQILNWQWDGFSRALTSLMDIHNFESSLKTFSKWCLNSTATFGNCELWIPWLSNSYDFCAISRKRLNVGQGSVQVYVCMWSKNLKHYSEIWNRLSAQKNFIFARMISTVVLI